MWVDSATGRLQEVAYVESPHRGARPKGAEPELIVIHGISLPEGIFGNDHVLQLFTNRLDTRNDERFTHLAGLRVSAHLYIHRDGHITQFVPFTQRAWHAGHSSFAGRSECNDFSIGIELEGTDQSHYADIQYQCLEAVIPALRDAYPGIAEDRVVGHCHIAPGRKSDPGPLFDWGRLQRTLGIRQPVTQPQRFNK
ncbi:MAG: 1,6-anhydro-N-acetylmuramyl-L-alanine amidase AmpD [Spiribacter sp.]|jgi:AmpD protein|nr:1,6-anhydro-N-acetylmuramyl-L-alanine amidase AmpD [Spiribacter sp.]